MIQLHCRNNRVIKLYKVIEEVVIFIQIVFIDIIMAADNAIIIGLVAASFAPANRKRIIMWPCSVLEEYVVKKLLIS